MNRIPIPQKFDVLEMRYVFCISKQYGYTILFDQAIILIEIGVLCARISTLISNVTKFSYCFYLPSKFK